MNPQRDEEDRALDELARKLEQNKDKFNHFTSLIDKLNVEANTPFERNLTFVLSALGEMNKESCDMSCTALTESEIARYKIETHLKSHENNTVKAEQKVKWVTLLLMFLAAMFGGGFAEGFSKLLAMFK